MTAADQLIRRAKAAELVAPLIAAAVERLDGAEKTKFLRKLVTTAVADSVAALDPKSQAKLLVAAVTAGLEHLGRGEPVHRACANLTDLVSVNPLAIDPRSLSVSNDPARPVVVGPWLMEIGFELIYWIPFLRAELSRLGVARERVVVVSRGGAAAWYGEIAGRYLDVLDVLSPEEFHHWTATEVEERLRGNRKPFEYGRFEADLLKRIVDKADIGDHDAIMPSAMNGLFRNAWRSRLGAMQLVDYLSFAPLTAPPFDRSGLPFDGDYVAVKLYYSRTFPRSAEAEVFCRELVRALASKSPVVLLENSVQLDDHYTIGFSGQTRYPVFNASALYEARDNLAVQTALVANAKALHGTYGGFSYLGPLLSVPTFAYTGNYDFTGTHLDLAFQMIDRLKIGRLALLPATPAVIDLVAADDSKAGREADDAAAV